MRIDILPTAEQARLLAKYNVRDAEMRDSLNIYDPRMQELRTQAAALKTEADALTDENTLADVIRILCQSAELQKSIHRQS